MLKVTSDVPPEPFPVGPAVVVVLVAAVAAGLTLLTYRRLSNGRR